MSRKMKCYPKKQILLVNVICDISPAYTLNPKRFSRLCAAAYAAARREPSSHPNLCLCDFLVFCLSVLEASSTVTGTYL